MSNLVTPATRAAGASRLLNEFQTHPATRLVCGRSNSHKQRYSRSIQLLPPSESGSGSTNCTLFNSGPVRRPICNDDDELDQLLNNVHLNQTWMVVILVMWILLWYRGLWLSGLAQTNHVVGRVGHSLTRATEKGARRELCQWPAFSTQKMLAVSITWPFAPWLYNKKAGQVK